MTISRSAMKAAAALGSMDDPYWENVVSLINFNNDWSDAKGNIITPYGNSSIDYSNSLYGGGCGRFDNAAGTYGVNYLNVSTASKEFDFLVGDFTIECWINPTSYPSSGLGGIFDSIDVNTSQATCSLFLRYDGTLLFYGAGITLFQITKYVPLGVWSHVAITRYNGVLNLFFNGVLTYTGAMSGSMGPYTSFFIGSAGSWNSSYNGLIDGFRVTKGLARYKSGFLCPSAPFPGTYSTDPYDANVTSLLHFDNDLTDVRGNTWTNTSAVLSATQSRFGGYSVNFPSGSKITSSTNVVAFGDNDFTVECFAYLTNAAYAYFLGDRLSSSDYGFAFLYSGGQIQLQLANAARTSYSGLIQVTYTLSVNTWYHLAAVRFGSVTMIFVNGVLIGSGTISGALGSSSIATVGDCPTSAFPTVGFIDELRVTNGVARYRGNFTVPTSVFNNQTTANPSSQLYDPYLPNVVTLLHMENNTTDVAGHTFTNNGVTFSAAASRISGGYGAVFTSVSPYSSLSAPSTADFDMGSGDFTIEAWINPSASGSAVYIISRRQDTTYPVGCWALILVSGVPNFYSTDYNNMVSAMLSGGTVPLNTWTHLALCRQGSIWSILINGIVVSTVTSSVAIAPSSLPLYIGITPGYASNSFFTGYMDEVRITKGFARYPKSFDIPQSAFPQLYSLDPYISNVAVLLHFDGSVVDVCGNNTSAGTVPFATGQSGFGQCVVNDGSKSPPSVTLSSALGTADFTVEFFFNSTNVTAGYTIFDSTSGNKFRIVASSGTLSAMFNGHGPTASVAVSAGVWYHLAFVRSSGTITCYLNGVSWTTQANSLSFDDLIYYVGSVPNGTAPCSHDELRITRVARYLANFTPPTSPFPNPPTLQNADPYFANVKLLMHMDNSLEDIAGHAVTNNGVTFDAVTTKFLGYSAYHSSHYTSLSIANSTDFDFGSGDFTIELWAAITAFNSTGGMLVARWSIGPAPATGCDWYLYVFGGSSNQLQFGINTFTLSSTFTPQDTAFHHYAVVRSGNTINIFIDGVLSGSGSYSSSVPYTSSQPIRTGIWDATSSYITGYIDDLRITKGVARYTANFFPLNTPFPNFMVNDPYFSNVVLLLHGEGANNGTVFDEVTGRVMAVYLGTPITSTTQNKFGSSSLALNTTSFNSASLKPVSSAGMDLSSGSLTMEAWVYPTTIDATHRPIIQSDGSNVEGLCLYHNSTNLFIYNSGYKNTMPPLALNTWSHVALVVDSGMLTLFLNGAASAPMAIGTAPSFTNWTLGANPSGTGESFIGYMDEIRVTKVARYKGNFTLPTSPFPNQ